MSGDQARTHLPGSSSCSMAGGDGKRMPSDNELDIARFQGNHVAQIAKRLAAR